MILFHWRQWPRWAQISAAALGAACIAVVIIWMLPSFLTRYPSVGGSERHKAITDTRTGLVAAVVAAGAAGGLAYTARTYRLSTKTLALSQETLALSTQGQFTDRYSRAIELLGDEEKLQVRLGGIYALERLMADSARDQPTILEVLAAWVRERTTSLTPVPDNVATDVPDNVTTDVQAALTVIGRRTPVANERPIDLRRAVLDGADLNGAHLENARLGLTHLDAADLSEAHLEDANLGGAHLEDANLGGAHLEDANLSGAHLEHANLTGAHLENAHLRLAHLENAHLGGAHLENANLSEAHLENAFLGLAHLEDARLGGAHLGTAFLGGAHFDRADLSGADLSRTRRLSQSQLDGSIVDNATKLPKGLHPPEARPPPVG